MKSKNNIPEYVAEYCIGHDVEYVGEYNHYKAYMVTVPPDDDGRPAMTGYPCYILWDPSRPDELEQVSDIDLKITNTLFPD